MACTSPVPLNPVPPPIPQLPTKSLPAATNNNASDYSSNKANNYDRFSESKFSVSNSNFNHHVGGNQSSDTSSPPMQKTARSTQPSPYSYLNPKRFSSPPFSDFSFDKGVNVKNQSSSIIRSKSKKEQRNYHSMNETIEVLADQVIEDERIVSIAFWFRIGDNLIYWWKKSDIHSCI